MSKIKVAVLFGGISAEHDVSVMSAKSVMENLDKSLFEIIPVKIEKTGKFDIKKVKSADVVFPVLHGKGGEDGSIQGFCKIIGKPYVGCGIEASVLALDKIASKIIWQSLGLPVTKFIFFDKSNWREKSKEIGLPAFIKPANTGSSIGISKVVDQKNLKRAIKEAFRYDWRIIAEEALSDVREIEVSILGNEGLIISVPGEVIPADEFYTYDAKYHNAKSKLIIPAKLKKNQVEKIKDLAEKAYRALGCSGMARADFFIDKSEEICINELNTIPGFTKISMYPKLMEASGIKYKDLLTRLIKLADDQNQR